MALSLPPLAALPLLFVLPLVASNEEAAFDEAESRDLTGLWEARRSFGPRVRGPLTVIRDEDGWTAEVGSHRVDAIEDAGWISFELAGDRGRFRGRLAETGPIVGHWTQPATQHAGMRCASPVVLKRSEPTTWRGDVVPLDDGFTFYLVVEERDDGSTGAFLRNPDRNAGVFSVADRIERVGDEVRLVGHWRGNRAETVLSRGLYSTSTDSFTLSLRGATYDFHRVVDDPTNDFYARGRDPEPWSYHAPPALDDGWPVGTLDEVGMSEQPIRELIETVIDPPADSLHAPYIHGMLIARHGRLVVEEYFHGFHRGVPHDTRSAQKSMISFLAGAAMHAGEPVELSMPVYETIGGPHFDEALDERARRMTLEHLLTMSAGLDCDEGDPNSPGNESRLQSQEENPDWYDYTLALDVVREPGERAVYCSINPNLAGNVLIAATGKPLKTLFHEYVAEPLDFGRYHLYLQPTGEPYFGGGGFFLARDFLKLGQVMLDDGIWNGRRVLSREFARASGEPLVDIGGRGYGYLWWVIELPYRDTIVEGFYAAGNGGQVVMAVPELGLTVLFYAGNYSDSVTYRIQEELVPEYVLRAVE
ncbi:MAG: serine hydrolase [Planctomycetota bacterium]